ncbi:hypothetical protein HanLR1_Chr14g0509511 [Helianthus annuus]|nr:hypothetical protein HanLR1_Chr14g0509511 [Helianthus annuus]
MDTRNSILDSHGNGNTSQEFINHVGMQRMKIFLEATSRSPSVLLFLMKGSMIEKHSLWF